MRRTAIVLCLLLLVPASAHAQGQGPPYDVAIGAADARTGTIGSAMVRGPLPEETGYAAFQFGVAGLVGRTYQSPAVRVRATAVVEAVRFAFADPDADLCIQIWAPATATRPAMPNHAEGGGPVCRRLRDAHEIGSGIQIQTYAEPLEAREVSVDVFVGWLAHPLEFGSTVQGARVTEIGFAPA
jgi:hypothetical protein